MGAAPVGADGRFGSNGSRGDGATTFVMLVLELLLLLLLRRLLSWRNQDWGTCWRVPSEPCLLLLWLLWLLLLLLWLLLLLLRVKKVCRHQALENDGRRRAGRGGVTRKKHTRDEVVYFKGRGGRQPDASWTVLLQSL